MPVQPDAECLTSLAAPKWNWPQDDTPIDLQRFTLRHWTKHAGDSLIVVARPRKARGASGAPPPAFYLKYGRDAIGERIYSLLARYLDVPSAVVAWTTYTDLLEAAIRYEPDAWRPRRIDSKQAIATAEDGHVEPIANPLDYARHLALSDLLGECDGVEVMMRRGTLFRIDAADIGVSLYSSALHTFITDMLGVSGQTMPHASSLFEAQVDSLGARDLPARDTYLQTLRRIAADEQTLIDQVAHDLVSSPGAAGLVAPYPREPFEEQPLLPMAPRVADAFARLLRQRCAEVRALSVAG